MCFHTFTRKFHPTGIVAGGTAAGAFSPAAALPFLEEIDEWLLYVVTGSPSPSAHFARIHLSQRESLGKEMNFVWTAKGSHLGELASRSDD